MHGPIEAPAHYVGNAHCSQVRNHPIKYNYRLHLPIKLSTASPDKTNYRLHLPIKPSTDSFARLLAGDDAEQSQHLLRDDGGAGRGYRCGKLNAFLGPFLFTKTIDLPRQARDKRTYRKRDKKAFSAGNLTHTYEQLSIWQDTLVVLAADNGGHVGSSGNNAPLRGEKSTNFVRHTTANFILIAQFPTETHSEQGRFAERNALQTIGKVQNLGDSDDANRSKTSPSTLHSNYAR
jgi:hypothetical protein